MPMFDLVALKAKLEASALVFDMQLKIVVFPVFVRPMMPQLRAIIESFFDFKKGRAKLKILASSEKK